MKKITLFILLILLSSFVSAEVYMAVDDRIPVDGNLEIYFTPTSGLYAIEVQFPSSFVIISDPSNGVLSNNVYRTTYSDVLKIIVRVSSENSYSISGKYTDGSGVKSFPTKTVEVYNTITSELRCPECPSDTLWSNCNQGRQSRQIYSCSQSTSYACVKTNEYRTCTITPQSTSVCVVGWACIDDNTLGLQNAECGYSSTVDCKLGCDIKENKCKSENLITGAATSVGETTGKAGNWFGNIFIKLIDWLKNLFSFNI